MADLSGHYARWLEQLLRDESLWDALESFSDDPVVHDELTGRALEIYRATWTTYIERIAGTPTEFDMVVGLLRDVAGTCAVLSRSWPMEERVTLALSSRTSVELVIVEYGLDDWAADLGVNLPVADDEEESIAEDDDEANEPEFQSELASSWISVSGVFHDVLEARRAGETWFRKERLRESICGAVSAGRALVHWARERGEEEALFVAAALLVAAETVFIASREAEVGVEPIPDERFVGTILRETGGIGWLDREGIGIPDWLLS